MAKIVRFPLHREASSDCRSNASIEIRPSDSRTSGILHLWGTEPRSLHFSKAFWPTPSLRAVCSINFHSSDGVFIARIITYKSSELQLQFSGRPKWLKTIRLTMATKEELGIRQRIKAAMTAYEKNRGWSQREMADFLHISLKNYEGYLRPDRGVPVGIIARFCNFTDTDVNYIMGTEKVRKTA